MKFVKHEMLHENFDPLYAASFAFTKSYGLLSLDWGKRSYTLYLYKNVGK